MSQGSLAFTLWASGSQIPGWTTKNPHWSLSKTPIQGLVLQTVIQDVWGQSLGGMRDSTKPPGAVLEQPGMGARSSLCLRSSRTRQGWEGSSRVSPSRSWDRSQGHRRTRTAELLPGQHQQRTEDG